jgi:hypothetical protein
MFEKPNGRICQLLDFAGAPYGIRTRVSALMRSASISIDRQGDGAVKAVATPLDAVHARRADGERLSAGHVDGVAFASMRWV